MPFSAKSRPLRWTFLLPRLALSTHGRITIASTRRVAEAINKVRSSKLDLFSEAMDSYVNSVLELFNFVGAEEEGGSYFSFSPQTTTRA